MIAWLCLLLLSPAAAEPLTLEDALTRAQDVSTAIALQELSSEAAEAGYRSDPRVGAPSLRVGVGDFEVPTGLDPVPEGPDVSTRLRFPFPRPWELHSAAKQGDATVAREDAELDGIREDLRSAVTRRFHAIPLLRSSVEGAERLRTLRDEHQALIVARRAEGLATALDWLDSEEARRAADDRVVARAAALEDAEAELRLLLDWPADQGLELVADDAQARAEAPLPSAESLLAGLHDRDPRAAEARAGIARAEARLQRERGRSAPWLDWAQGGAVFRNDGRVGFEVGVALDIPIYHWDPARTRAASQEVLQAKLQLEEAQKASERRLAQRLRSTATAKQRWEVETAHREAIAEQAEPLMELADPVLRLELAARSVRAELRVLKALVDLVDELDRLDAEAHQAP